MKMVLAFIQPFKLDAVTRALEGVPQFGGMTVTHGSGFGREHFVIPPHDAREELAEFTDKARIEAVVQDDQVDLVIAAIGQAARTGRYGDGMVFVLPVERALRIMTLGEGAAEL